MGKEAHLGQASRQERPLNARPLLFVKTRGYALLMSNAEETKYPRISVRMDKEMLEKVSKLASKRKVSNSKVIKEALDYYMGAGKATTRG